MKETTFFDWTVHYPEHLTAVKDDTEKKENGFPRTNH